MSVSEILADLHPETVAKAQELIAESNLLDAGRLLGYDVSRYDNLVAAGRLLMYHHSQNTPKTFLEYVKSMNHVLNPLILEYAETHQDQINAAVEAYKHWEYDCDWFSANTEYRTYLLKSKFNGDPLETPTYANMRIAIQLYHRDTWTDVERCFQELCEKYLTPASPTIFNAGTKRPQMSSCFLMTVADNLESILYTGVGDAGIISKSNGGLGIDVSRLRHSEVFNSGSSSGLLPILQLYNSMIRLCNQGGKRPGAAAISCRICHLDVMEFIQISDKIGDQYQRAHDLNTSLWVPDLFWKRVQADEKWTLFCPAKTSKLNDVWGEEFEKLYIEAENDPTIPAHARKTMRAQEILQSICEMQRKSGMPYIMHSDNVNRKSNQKNIGMVRSANLCQEVVEVASDDEIPSCNLASLSLKRFVTHSLSVNRKSPIRSASEFVEKYDFKLLGKITQSAVRNLNRVIDNNYCPLDQLNPDGSVRVAGKIRRCNERHRPIGLGVSGLAEAIYQMDLDFESPLTAEFNKMVFACIYFNALKASVQLAIQEGPYETFQGSPFSQGKLQFDLWADEFKKLGPNKVRTEEDHRPLDPKVWGQVPLNLLDADGNIVDTIQPTWDDLKRVVVKYGTRNSLLTTLMPTATTAQKLRNTESAEAPLAVVYSRKVMNGSYPIINAYLIDDLDDVGLWNDSVLEFIKAKGGSVQGLTQFINSSGFSWNNDFARLQQIEKKYKTMWELSQKIFLKHAASRGIYVDMSQSQNVYLRDPSNDQLAVLHVMTHMLGNKCGIYYLRSAPGYEAIKFTVDPKITKFVKESEEVCTKEMRDAGCLSCQ